MSDDHDLARITAIAAEGLRLAREGAEEDGDTELRMDTFVVTAIFVWDDSTGEEREGVCVWSESKRHHIKQGVLHRGLDRLDEGAS